MKPHQSRDRKGAGAAIRVWRLAGARSLAVAALWLLGGTASAQVVSVSVSSPSSRLVMGDTLQLTAVGRNAAGEVTPAQLFWFSVDTGVLEVDQRGVVSAVGLGIGVIAAGVSEEVFAVAQLQVLPRRLEVRTSRSRIFVGTTVDFRATAYDAGQQAIPNVEVEWFVAGVDGNETRLASIDENGRLDAMARGPVTVTARIEYDQSLADIQPFFAGELQVEIEEPTPYKVTRLLSTADRVAPGELRPTYQFGMSANDRGQIAFIGSIDGLSTSLMLHDNGRYSQLATAGAPAEIAGGHVGFFRTPAINDSGEVVTTVGSWGQLGAGLISAVNGEALYLALEGEPIGGLDEASDFVVTRDSLNASGDILFSALGLSGNQEVPALMLFRDSPRRIVSHQSIPAFGTIESFPEFGLGDGGEVVFLADSGERIGLFRRGLTSPVEQLLATGDQAGGRTVVGIRNLVVSESGEAACIIDTSEGPGIARTNGGQIETLFPRWLVRVFSLSNAAGVLFLGGAEGDGLHQWRDGMGSLLLNLSAPAPTGGGTVLAIRDAFAKTSGGVLATIRTESNEALTLELGAAPRAVMAAGERLPFDSTLYVNAISPISAAAAGDPLLLVGEPFSLFRLRGSRLDPVLRLGDPLNSVQGFSGAGAVEANGLSEAYVVSGEGVHVSGPGGVRTILASETQATDGAMLYFQAPMAVNRAGAVVVSALTDRDSFRLYRFDQGRLTLLTAVGEEFQGLSFAWRHLAIDDQGRAYAAAISDDDRQSLLVWEEGAWRLLGVAGELQVAGRTANQIFALASRAGKVYGVFSFNPLLGDFAIAEITPAGVQPAIVSPDNVIMQGYRSIAAYNGFFDVNSEGEVAYGMRSIGDTVLVVRSGGRNRRVASSSTPLPNGDRFQHFFGVDLRDNGELYFAAQDQRDHVNIYQAKRARPTPQRSRQ